MVSGASNKATRTREVVLYLVGMTAYWFLLRRSNYQSIFTQDSYYLVFTLVAAIAALMAIAFAGKQELLFQHRRSITAILTTVFSLVASVAVVLRSFLAFDSGGWVWFAGAVSFGVSFALLTIWWGVLFMNQGMRTACLLVLASFPLAIVLGLICSLEGLVSSIFLLAFPLVSVLCAWALQMTPERTIASGRTGLEDNEETYDISGDDSDPVSIISVFVLFLLAGSITRGFYYSSLGGVPAKSMIQMDLLTLLFCVILALVVASSRKGGKRRVFLQAWMILSILFFVGLILAMVVTAGDDKWGDELTLIARLLLSLLLWLVLLHVSIDSRRPVVMMSLWVIAETSSSIIAHYIIPLAVSRFPGISNSFAVSTVLPLALFVLLIGASFFFLQRVIQSLDSGSAAEATEDPRIARCRRIAEECNLSAREQEIMILYAQGMSSRAIAGNLFISPDTVRTHVKNIYDKVGVHKKQELIDKVRGDGTLSP